MIFTQNKHTLDFMSFFLLVFFTFWEENFLMDLNRKLFDGLEKKTHDPYHLFSFLPT